jgi:hypothetical protein
LSSTSLTLAAIEAAVGEHGSIRKAATALGRDESVLRRRLKRAGSALAPSSSRSSLAVDGDEATLIAPDAKASTVEALIRENGLDPAEWIVVSTTINRWDGPVKGGGTQPLRQVKVTLRRKPEHVFPVVARHVPAIVRPKNVRRDPSRPRLVIVEGDHQAPYFDPELDAAATAMHADLQPDEQVFLGDGLDLPTASRHADHPAAQASPQECIDAYYAILRRRREAAPGARARKLKGNHDWRLESYLLDHAAKFYGLRPADSDVPALSLQNLLALDALGVELVEDPRGWDHGEVELVEGQRGLVVRHGWLTGANTAGRSLAKRGRSLLVGHTHGREHVFAWDPSAGVERQAAVVGTMSRVRHREFPHFAVSDSWLQGLATVAIWPDGSFMIEHARWDGRALHWRDRRWTP